MTLAEAIKQYMQETAGPVTSDMVKRAVEERYPGQWKVSSVQAHLYACQINNPKAYIHHPSAERFLYKNSDGTFVLYDEKIHGPNEWAPGEEIESEEGPEELVQSSISLERDMEDHLVQDLGQIEPGLVYIARQVATDVGRVDIQGRDARGVTTVIEVKVGEAKDSAIGQIARYIGWFMKTEKVRAILIASDFPEPIRYAARAIPNLKLMKYRVHFSFEEPKD